MAETNKPEWVLAVCAKQAPRFEKVQEILEGKGVRITPRDYLDACKYNGLNPDIDPIYVKIAEGSATIEDVNLLLEDVASSVRDRIQRRVRKSPTAGHITHGGRQKLGGGRPSGRVNPKRKRSGHTQEHGRGEHGHDKSTDKQRQRAANESADDGSSESDARDGGNAE